MKNALENNEPECQLCGGTGQVTISSDGTDENTDYYGCPICISRELSDEIKNLENQRNNFLNAATRLAARGWFEPSTCADSETLADMALMRQVIDGAA